MIIPDSTTEGFAEVAELVHRIRCGDQCASEELYRLLREGIGFLVRHELGFQDAEDRIHDIFVIVLRAIYEGKLLNPSRVLAYTRAVTKRRIATEIRECVKRRATEVQMDTARIPSSRTPEHQAVEREESEIMKKVLLELTPKYREILTRYYVLGETKEQISQDMNLTETQFRLLKWRAKARFAALARRSLKMPVSEPRAPFRQAIY